MGKRTRMTNAGEIPKHSNWQVLGKASGAPLCEHAFQLFYERSCRHRKHATSSCCEQQSCLQQRRINQWESHHVARWDQRLAWLAEVDADAAIHVSESLHRFDRV